MSTSEIPLRYNFPPDVAALVRNLMAERGYASEDDLLRGALTQLAEFQDEADDWPAIKEALDELEQGVQGLPVDEAFAQLRQRHNLPPE